MAGVRVKTCVVCPQVTLVLVQSPKKLVPPMPTCTGVTKTGAPCKKNAVTRADHGLCSLHHHMSMRAPDWTYHTGPPCIATTKKGEPCRSSVHIGLEVCRRHAGMFQTIMEERERARIAAQRAQRAAKTIQCMWREAISNPEYNVCKRRLMNEFNSM